MTLLGSQHSILIRSKFRSVLQFRLQQRRTRESKQSRDTQAEQGSMPLNHGKFPKQEDSYAFEEDSSSGSLSPEQQLSEPESHSSVCASTDGSTLASTLATSIQLPGVREQPEPSLDDGLNSQITPPIPVPAIVKSKSSDKNRHKKPKDVKPKVKKLKYHQYIPPDQKGEKSPPPMDSAYARLLQQQQLFLQLQILSQQKHHQHSPAQSSQGPTRPPTFSYQHPTSTHTHKVSSDQLSCSPGAPSNPVQDNSPSPLKNSFPNQNNMSLAKPGPLPANLDDLKVSELRQHLRMRGLPVSGTKTALIERLRPFTDPCCSSPPSDITTLTFPVTPSGSLTSSSLSQGFYPYPSVSSSSSPPVSPASSELSLSGSLPDSFSDMPLSPPTHLPLQPSPESLEEGLGVGLEAEKDKMLVEKQKVIDELTWKLHQEQRQVEELKMQLHKRKRCYGPSQEPGALQPPRALHSPSLMGPHFFGVAVKQEPLSSSCPLSSPKQLKSPGAPHMEEMGLGSAGPGSTLLMDGPSNSGNMSTFLSPQCSPQDSPAGKSSSSPQPPSPHAPYLLTPPLGRNECGHPPGSTRLVPMQMQQKNSGQLMNFPYPSEHRGVQAVYPSDSGTNHGTSVKSEHMPKQMNRSQQMDELLDVLIENGGCQGLLVPRFHRHFEHPPPTQIHYDHAASHLPESHLETLLSAPTGRGVEGEMEANSGHPRPPHYVPDKLLLSGPELQGVTFSMAFTDAAWDSMEWLDLTPPTNTCSTVPPSAPSIFTSEFLDVTDMNLGSAMDIHLDHW